MKEGEKARSQGTRKQGNKRTRRKEWRKEMRKENGKMNHWKSANFGSDKHAKLSPPQFFADGGRAGSDGQW